MFLVLNERLLVGFVVFWPLGATFLRRVFLLVVFLCCLWFVGFVLSPFCHGGLTGVGWCGMI